MFFLKSLIFKNPNGKNQIRRLTPDQFATGIKNKKVQLVDVRTPSEYNQGKIKGSVNLNFYSSDFKNDLKLLKREHPVYLYCRSGIRSHKAGKRLIKLGYQEVYDLKGGIMSWTGYVVN